MTGGEEVIDPLEEILKLLRERRYPSRRKSDTRDKTKKAREKDDKSK